MAEQATNGAAIIVDDPPVAVDALPAPRDPIRVDISGLTFGDLVTLEKLERGDSRELSAVVMLEFLNRIVIGGVDHVSITRAREIMIAVQRAVKASANPNDSG